MNNFYTAHAPNHFSRMAAIFLGACLVMLAFTAMVNGQIDGFTAPFRSIELSSDESGSIASLKIEEGDSVSTDDIVARLDGRVQELQLKIAAHLAKTTSELVATKETLDKRKSIATRLKEMKSRGHASESEIIRAEMELSIATAKYLAAQEEQTVREIEQRRAEVQLKRRTITAPFDGVVAKIHRREGEFLSPLHPEIATIIQVNQLLATFAVPSGQLSMLKIGEEFEIQMENGKKVSGTVYRIGVQTDAQSGTVEVKLIIENPSMKIRSGEICTLNI